MRKLLLIPILFFSLLSFGQKKYADYTPVSTINATDIFLLSQTGTMRKTRVDTIGEYIIRRAITNNSFKLENSFSPRIDTVPGVTFGIGSGAIADTACFNNSRLAGSFTNGSSDTLIIVAQNTNMLSGSGSETIAIQVCWGDTLNDVIHTHLTNAATTITSHTARTALTSFNNTKIPPSAIVWMILSGASSGNKPTYLESTLSWYKKPNHTH
jgi:hypothetical protein